MKRTAIFITVFLVCSVMWVNAQKNWMEGWDGGTLTGPGSEPDKFGWLCDKADFDGWAVADYEVAGTVRYSTTLAAHCAIFDSVGENLDYPDFPLYYDNNRLLILRWDGNFVNYYAYKLAGLKAGKKYRFSWVYAWYDNADRCELRAAINKNPVSTITDNSDWESGVDVNDDLFYQYFFEIMDDLRGPTDGFAYTQMKTVHPNTFEFTAPEDGDYYFTLTCTHVVAGEVNEFGSPNGPMAMVGGFSVTEEGGGSSLSATADKNITIRVENNQIFVDGADSFTVASITGERLDPTATLNTGIYIVGVNGQAYKTIVK